MSSTQAKVALTLSLIVYVIVELAIFTSGLPALASLMFSVVALPFVIFFIWLQFKSTNCMVQGDCGIFAWVFVGLFALSVLSMSISLVVAKLIQVIKPKPKPVASKEVPKKAAVAAPVAHSKPATQSAVAAPVAAAPSK